MSDAPRSGVAGAATRQARSARVATALVFALHAAVFASWTPHIPLVKDHLGLHDGTLGLALLGAPVGSVCAMLLAGHAVARWGSRRVVFATLLGYLACGPLLGLAWSPGALFGALALWGAFQGSLDVAMNAQGVAVEQAYGRPILSSFHAWWSLGAFAGTGLGALAIAMGIDLTVQLTGLAVLLGAAAWPLIRRMLGDDGATEEHHLGVPWRDRRIMLLAALMFAGLLCEGAVGDWAAVYLRDSLGVPASSAGLGYAAFAVAMFAGRAMGDRWVARYGAARVVATLAALGAVGLGCALLVGQPWLALIGFAAFGLGLACIVPVAFSAAAAGSDGHAGQAIAGVATAGWAGFLLGPPLIGLLAQASSRPVALALLPLLCVGIVAGARNLPGRAR
ncbi:MFS transporter [Solihabitans fulvus]|uniref:MFS transporter n=1 Tax=Solihabitans fulvus TaxID=1892852 RepID=A0A5B2WSV9_9PSEU|nr:MFS transporter [Solihabitans fulvus]KAA2252977.1 MFS transporter [Solihabitans fulvus]